MRLRSTRASSGAPYVERPDDSYSPDMCFKWHSGSQEDIDDLEYHDIYVGTCDVAAS